MAETIKGKGLKYSLIGILAAAAMGCAASAYAAKSHVNEIGIPRVKKTVSDTKAYSDTKSNTKAYSDTKTSTIKYFNYGSKAFSHSKKKTAGFNTLVEIDGKKYYVSQVQIANGFVYGDIAAVTADLDKNGIASDTEVYGLIKKFETVADPDTHPIDAKRFKDLRKKHPEYFNVQYKPGKSLEEKVIVGTAPDTKLTINFRDYIPKVTNSETQNIQRINEINTRVAEINSKEPGFFNYLFGDAKAILTRAEKEAETDTEARAIHARLTSITADSNVIRGATGVFIYAAYKIIEYLCTPRPATTTTTKPNPPNTWNPGTGGPGTQ